MTQKNCWEYWECDKETMEKCPAYTTQSGDECFNVAKNFCPRLRKEFRHCWECPWYKKMNPENARS